ncbi:MAG: inverse autotransporter beta domain-containing protein [Planctomycetales bacterium]
MAKFLFRIGMSRAMWNRLLLAGMTWVLLLLAGPSCAVAQDDEDDEEGWAYPPGVRSVINTGAGIKGGLGHRFGQAPGQDDGITPAELMPYYLMDEAILFGDLRTFATDIGRFGTNVGVGGRYYNEYMRRLFGGSIWYDIDDSSKATFHQIGFNLETRGQYFDVHGNYYLPVSNTEKQLNQAVIPGSARFVGHQFWYDQARLLVTAMQGGDIELGVPIPGGYTDAHDVRIFGAGYMYQGGDQPNISGGRGGLTFNPMSNIGVLVQVSHDNYYDTSVMVGLTWTWSGMLFDDATPGRRHIFDRIAEGVRRNYNIVSPQRTIIENNVIARNPLTGQAYEFNHVASYAPTGGDGTVEHPFSTIAGAQGPASDVIFVHAGSVFSGSAAQITLTSGQKLWGESAGMDYRLLSRDFGTILLPHATSGADRPELNAAPANAITLASNTELAGFVINSPAGYGISGTGVHDISIRGVDVNNSGGDGIHLTNLSGSNSLSDIGINGSHGSGLALVNASGTTSIGALAIANTIGHGVDISGGTGTIQFQKPVSLSNISGASVNIDGLDAAGNVLFGNLDISGRNGIGIHLNDVAGHVGFSGTTNIGTPNGGTAAAIDFQGSTGTVEFQTINIASSGGEGILIGNNTSDNTGQFTVHGLTTIQNTASAAIRVFDDAAQVNFGDVTVSGRFAQGILLDGSRGPVNFNGTTNISNANHSGADGVLITNTSGNVTFDVLNLTQVFGSSGLHLLGNSATTYAAELNISGDHATGLLANNGGRLNVDAGTIAMTAGPAVDMQSTTMGVTLTSVSADSSGYGVRLMNTPGTFNITGDGTTDGSGGTIAQNDTGIQLINAGNVNIARVNLQNNDTGIYTQGTQSLTVNNTRIVDSTNYAIDSVNTQNMTIQNSWLANENIFSSNSIHAVFNSAGTYNYTFASNTIAGDVTHPISLVDTSPTGAGVLNLTAFNNTLISRHAGDSALNIAWNGVLSGTIRNNVLQGTADNNTSLTVNNASTSAMTTLTVQQNTIFQDGLNGRGFVLNAAGPTSVTFSQNSLEFSKQGSIGTEFTLPGLSDVKILSNTFTQGVDGDTGLLFHTMTAPSTVQISNNTITMYSTNSLVHRGIVFETVNSTTDDKLILQSSQNNIINGASTLMTIPAGSYTGKFLVNGSQIP